MHRYVFTTYEDVRRNKNIHKVRASLSYIETFAIMLFYDYRYLLCCKESNKENKSSAVRSLMNSLDVFFFFFGRT